MWLEEVHQNYDIHFQWSDSSVIYKSKVQNVVYVKQEITILFFVKKLSNHSCTLHVINYQWKYDSQAHNYLCLCMCVSISKQLDTFQHVSAS